MIPIFSFANLVHGSRQAIERFIRSGKVIPFRAMTRSGRLNDRGVALAVSLFAMTLIVSLSAVFVLRSIQEGAVSRVDVSSAKTVYTAEAGAKDGLLTLYNLINFYMLNTVSATTPSVLASQAGTYASTKDGVGFLVAYVKNNGAALLTKVGTEAVYTGTLTAFDGGTYSGTIYIGALGNPTAPAPNVWDFPFYFKIQTAAVNQGKTRKTILHGDFTVQVQKDNFARYALYTVHQTIPNGTAVWFTERTNFTGPVLTNDRFSFAHNPSGIFDGTVKQVSTQARFYNNNNPVLLDADANGTRDVPLFTSGFQRGATAVTMPTSSQESDMASEASGGNTYNTDGIYVPVTGTTLKGGIYVHGNANVTMGLDAQDRQTLTIVQGGTTKTVTIDKTANQTIVKQGSTNTTYTGLPFGKDGLGTLIYVNGDINSLGGTVQRANQMTIATKNNITIKDNIRYEDYTPATGTPGTTGYTPPTAEGKDNLLGILSWNGDVVIDSNAPQNVEIDATVMAKSGQFCVDEYDTINPRGIATLLGGVISNYYGAFGTFDSSTGQTASGYGRNFVYDTRMESATTPPYFPTMNTFIAFTNNVGDKLAWQQGGF